MSSRKVHDRHPESPLAGLVGVEAADRRRRELAGHVQVRKLATVTATAWLAVGIRPLHRVHSIILRQQDGRQGAVGLGDDPEADPGCGVVGRQEPGPLNQGPIIRRPVLGTDQPPVASQMLLKRTEDVGVIEMAEGIGRRHDGPNGQARR